MTLGVGDVFEDVLPQGALDEGHQAAAQRLQVTVDVAVLGAEAAFVAELNGRLPTKPGFIEQLDIDLHEERTD